MKSLDCNVPDYIGPQAGSTATDNDIIVNGDILCPEGFALLRPILGAVLEADGWRDGEVLVGMAQGGLVPDVAMALPVGRDDDNGLLVCTRRRQEDCLRARRLHPFRWGGGPNRRGNR